MERTLVLTRDSRPIPVRLIIGKNQAKDYILIVTKQGGLVLNKKIDLDTQN
jgi:hypothetical protein